MLKHCFQVIIQYASQGGLLFSSLQQYSQFSNSGAFVRKSNLIGLLFLIYSIQSSIIIINKFESGMMYWEPSMLCPSGHNNYLQKFRKTEPMLDSQLLIWAIQQSFTQFCWYQRNLQQQRASDSQQKRKINRKQNAEVIDISSDQQIVSDNIEERRVTINSSNKITVFDMDGEDNHSCEDSKKHYFKTQSPSLISEKGLQENIIEKDNIDHNHKERQMEIEEVDCQFIEFKAECPILGIQNAEILKKKQSLLNRKVTNWNQIQTKDKKPLRRELKKLYN